MNNSILFQFETIELINLIITVMNKIAINGILIINGTKRKQVKYLSDLDADYL